MTRLLVSMGKAGWKPLHVNCPFSFQFKDVLYENGKQTGADESPGELIAQLFSNTKCSLGESKRCGEGGKARRGKWQPGVIL